ncbi:MAG: protein-glutamate O-methyltransferase CheR [Hyphomicrobiales bacterium]|nr:protein-glutamate O-methyltransferase CheR [Hyphomicrobiales bacterium]
MNDYWFTSLCRLVESATGVVIDPDKQYLAESRLTPIRTQFGSDSLRMLVQEACARPRSALGLAVIEAMMTGETFFFRDISLFTEIRTTLLPQLIEQCAPKRSLRIWCAACSTGQEPYSIAMILDEFASELRGWQVQIVATDVSREAIERARSGIYNQFEVQRGLPVTHLLRHFHRDGDHWRISENMRTQVEFATGNLLNPEPADELFDMVLCRNVLIYFDQTTRKSVLRSLDLNLAQNGWLVVGSSEASSVKSSQYQNTRNFPTIFRKSKPAPVAASQLSVLANELAECGTSR